MEELVKLIRSAIKGVGYFLLFTTVLHAAALAIQGAHGTHADPSPAAPPAPRHEQRSFNVYGEGISREAAFQVAQERFKQKCNIEPFPCENGDYSVREKLSECADGRCTAMVHFQIDK